MSTFNTLIRGGNKIEKFRTGFQLVFAVVLSLFFIPCALYAIFRKRVYDLKTTGKILDVSDAHCVDGCVTHYVYKIGDKTFKGTVQGDYGDELTLFYNPQNPSESGPESTDTLTKQVTGRVSYRTHAAGSPKGCKRYTVNKRTTVKTPAGERTTTKPISMYSCFITYQYTVKGKTYTKQDTRDSSTEYKIGHPIDVYYESKNPENSRFASDDYRVVGGIASSIIVTSIIGLLVHYYLVSNVKGYGSFVLASRVMK
jgi:hypothetical protein